MKIKGNTFLITGGASGLGEACTRNIVKGGGNVVILDVNKQTANDLCNEIDPQSKSTLFVQTDVTSEADVKKAIQEAKDKFKRISGVINCAGIGGAQRIATQKSPHDLEGWKKVINVNLTGTFNVCRLVAHSLINQDADSEGTTSVCLLIVVLKKTKGERGIIINTSSVAAFEGQTGQTAYSASKGGIVSMTLVMARDLSRHGIRVVTIAPGSFNTPLMRMVPEDTLKKIVEPIQFPKRMGNPEEFAHLAVSIIENSYLNGCTIRLDAGVRLAAL